MKVLRLLYIDRIQVGLYLDNCETVGMSTAEYLYISGKLDNVCLVRTDSSFYFRGKGSKIIKIKVDGEIS